MGVVIENLHRMDGYHDWHFGTVNHNGNTCNAILVGDFDCLLALLHKDATAKYELNEITSVDVNLTKDDRLSGIYPLANDRIVVDGTIHNETVIDDNMSLFDVYIQNGADFLSLTSDDLPVRPMIDTRIRIVGKGLHVYPTFT